MSISTSAEGHHGDRQPCSRGRPHRVKETQRIGRILSSLAGLSAISPCIAIASTALTTWLTGAPAIARWVLYLAAIGLLIALVWKVGRSLDRIELHP